MCPQILPNVHPRVNSCLLKNKNMNSCATILFCIFSVFIKSIHEKHSICHVCVYIDVSVWERRPFLQQRYPARTRPLHSKYLPLTDVQTEGNIKNVRDQKCACHLHIRITGLYFWQKNNSRLDVCTALRPCRYKKQYHYTQHLLNDTFDVDVFTGTCSPAINKTNDGYLLISWYIAVIY